MTYYKPKDNEIYNPLLKYPRNAKCVCGSNKKFKGCCLDKLARYVPNNPETRRVKEAVDSILKDILND